MLEHAQGSNDRSSSCMSISQLPQTHQVLFENDPLFGILKEDQVGINLLSDRPCIAFEVLEEMRNYLLASSAEDIQVCGQRVISSVKEAEKNPITQRAGTYLGLPECFRYLLL